MSLNQSKEPPRTPVPVGKPQLQLRILASEDVTAIQKWPPYPAEFAELDYALRTNGWLNEYRNRPDTWCFAVEQAGELVAFTILAKTEATDAEFRIALRADKTGHGLGGAITTMTIAKGFSELGLLRIHLIVRKNNPRAIRLYTHLGFREQGECQKKINGKETSLLRMDLRKKGKDEVAEQRAREEKKRA